LAETKTSFGRRNIALTNAAIKALCAHQAQQYEARLKMGDAWNDRLDLVFPKAWGTINHPNNFVKRFFKPSLKRVAATQASIPCAVVG
jgi:hypothetical protein